MGLVEYRAINLQPIFYRNLACSVAASQKFPPAPPRHSRIVEYNDRDVNQHYNNSVSSLPRLHELKYTTTGNLALKAAVSKYHLV